MSDRDALIAAILANPDEDTPRLMFADWLDEHGDSARAEFIRVQCELARLRAAEVDLPDTAVTGYYRAWPVAWHPDETDQRRALFEKESELLAAHNAEWRKGLPKYADNTTTRQDVRFRRGFVGHTTVPIGKLMKEPAALWEHHPVESILLHYSGGNDRRKVPKCKQLAALRELRFLDNDGDDDTLAPYAECPHLSGLRAFNLGQVAVKDSGAQTLTRSPHLRPVALELACHALTPKGLTALLGGPFASQLRHFRLLGLPVGGAEVVADTPLGALRRLDFHCFQINDNGVRVLTRSGHLTQLVTLDLENNNLTDAALEALAAWPGLASVRVLNLGDNRGITGSGIAVLLKSPYFMPIHIGLRWTAIGDDGAKALAQWSGLANLIGLDLSHAQLSDTGALALAASSHWRDIRFLEVSNGNVGRDTIARLHDRVGKQVDFG